MPRLINIAAIATVSLVSSGCGSFFYMGQHPSVSHDPPRTQMKEDLREQIHTVIVTADGRKPTLMVSGDYGEVLPTASDGAKAGAKAGVQLTGEMLAEDPLTAILAPVALPLFMITGSIVGASAAKIQQEIQEFRNGLADELATDDDRPQLGDRLARELTAHLEAGTSVTPVTEDPDVALSLSVRNIDINTYDEDAVIVTNVRATLRDASNGSVIYDRNFEYGERKSLRNWAADDSAAWVPYAENARRYLAAEIAAELFERIHVRHVLRPVKTATFSGGWDASVRSSQPTLAWELFLLGAGSQGIDPGKATVLYDLEIFDGSRLVYAVRNLGGTSHKVATPLEDCGSLRWSVRPVYHFDDKTRAGNWMYMRSGFDKVKAAASTNEVDDTPAFWEHFAKLRMRCAS